MATLTTHIWLYADVLRDARFDPELVYPAMCGKSTKLIAPPSEAICKVCRNHYDSVMNQDSKENDS